MERRNLPIISDKETTDFKGIIYRIMSREKDWVLGEIYGTNDADKTFYSLFEKTIKEAIRDSLESFFWTSFKNAESSIKNEANGQVQGLNQPTEPKTIEQLASNYEFPPEYEIDSEPTTTNVVWKGYFIQEGYKFEMIFKNMQLKVGGAILGQGVDTVGAFSIQGHVTNQGHVKFIKQYGDKQGISYQGQLQGNLIRGLWNIGVHSDAFEIYYTTDCEIWTGWYGQSGQKYKMTFNLSIDRNVIEGGGFDQVGDFFIKGEIQGKNVRFNKTYNGSHMVSYSGILDSENNGRIIRGCWGINALSGRFELRSSQPIQVGYHQTNRLQDTSSNIGFEGFSGFSNFPETSGANY